MARLKELHRKQGFEYVFPDLDGPLFPVGVVGEEDGEAQIAGFIRVVGEAYLLLNQEHGTPRERWKALLSVHEAVRRESAKAGFSEVYCWIPPEVPDGFSKRLAKLGWREDRWRNFTFNL